VDFAIFYEIQVDSPLKHRERERQVFEDALDQVVLAFNLLGDAIRDHADPSLRGR
jgi:hypothetical protein